MPESNFSQTSMNDLVREAESQVESLTRALETLKSTVRRLSAQVAMSDGGAPAAGSGYGFGKPAANETPAPVVEEKPFDYASAASALARDLGEPEPPAISHQRPIAPMAEPQRQESEWYGVSDGGSWPVGPKGGAAKDEAGTVAETVEAMAKGDPHPSPLPGGEGTEGPQGEVADAAVVAETQFADWDLEMPDAVAEAEASSEVEAPAKIAAPDEGEKGAAGQEWTKKSLSSGWPDEGIWSQSFDWPAMRAGTGEGPAPETPEGPKDEFRSMVDQVRAEIDAARASGETMDLDVPGEDEPDDDAARRAEVQRMVEEMKNRADEGDLDDEGAFSDEDGAFDGEAVASTEASETAEDDEAKREEARRAVEQMRAEMSGGFGSAPPATPAPKLDWSHMQADLSGPPVLVVKDSEGRVELANVYDLLNRLDCGEGAALLNYTPHSVTVGLPIRAPVPTQESVNAAVNAVFGRTGSIDTDGGRITVQMGSDPGKKRREDAA